MARIAIIPFSKKGNADPYQNAMAYDIGDVVDILPDSHQFRPLDLATFVIIDAPGVQVSTLLSFLAADDGDKLQNLIAQRRLVGFDLAKWQLDGSKPLANFAQAQLYAKVKPRITDPNVLGTSPGVL